MSFIEKSWIPRNHSEVTNKPLAHEENQAGGFHLEWPLWVRQILTGRGVLGAEAQGQFLYPKLSGLKDPFSIVDMSLAVARLKKAYLKQEKICVYADFDLDGTSGLALLLNGLKSLGFQNVIGFQPRRLKHGYGFHAEVVDQLSEQNVDLIVTVDVGITGHAASERALERKIDVIITDHHQPSETLPQALAVVNPNRSECTSGLGYLSGAGVGFYLLRALRRELDDCLSESAKKWDLKSVLDFFTIATITDMVPLVEDNRILVKHGLVQLAQTQSAGLRELLKELNLWGRPLVSQDVGIRFAPKLNALSRLDQEILPIDIMLAESDVQAMGLVAQVIKSNQSRIEFQLDAESEAQRLLKEWADTDFIFLSSDQFHAGVIGLIANKLSQEKNVPVFIGSMDVQTQKIVGSSRAPAGSINLVEALGSATESLERFGGHPQAAGFELEISKKDLVIESLRGFFLNQEKQKKYIPTMSYDLELPLKELNHSFLKWYEFLGPFGQSFEVPLLRVNHVKVESLRKMKGGHLKLKISQTEVSESHSEFNSESSSGKNKKQEMVMEEAVYFSPPKWAEEILQEGSILDFLLEPQSNYFGGKKSIQFLIRDFKKKSLEV